MNSAYYEPGIILSVPQAIIYLTAINFHIKNKKVGTKENAFFRDKRRQTGEESHLCICPCPWQQGNLWLVCNKVNGLSLSGHAS